MNILKNIITPLLCYALIYGCSSGTNHSVAQGKEDTIHYTPPAKGYIPQNDIDRYHAAIQEFYEKDLVAKGFNGAILVAKKGNILFEAYHGFADLVKKDTINEHSAFHLASVSKTFTAMATLKLAELGKVNLDDDVKKYFPGFPYDGVSIKLLLSHRSGLPNYLYFMQQLGWDVKTYSNNQHVLDYLIQFKPALTSKPGTRFAYCNTNYALLGLIIEKVSGKTYARFLQDQFFTPLQ